ncbi:MAG TPA: hypothetical protein VNW92_27045, partial [Polyangiaceae bacterium]|nr:hypothetical protein [Polyangiaceae bacterium]
NLDRRVEVLFPVTNEAVRARIRHECLQPLSLDNQRVYEMSSDGTYQRRRPAEGQAPIDAQLRTWGIVAKATVTSSNGTVVLPAVLGSSLAAPG